MMEGKATWCGRRGGGSVCLSHCPGPHHLIFCLLQDMMDLFETNISDMVDSFVVTVRGSYPFLCASVLLTMCHFPSLIIYCIYIIPDFELVAEFMLPSIQFNSQCEFIFVKNFLDTVKHFPSFKIWKTVIMRKYVRMLAPILRIWQQTNWRWTCLKRLKE